MIDRSFEFSHLVAIVMTYRKRAKHRYERKRHRLSKLPTIGTGKKRASQGKERSDRAQVPRDVEIKRKRMWYPTEKIVVKTHEMMLQRFGGHPCFERGMPVFRHILEEIKKTNGIYRKAAIILRGIVIGRIFKDGNHRTAFEVTRTFLEMNGTRMKAKNAQEIIRIY